ncbi:hypothetical protein C7H19_18745 [Aphanothece hegewaldii CCALA 016]|uniref:Uncharacterized protein n=1 Tax=Aphanothece hegewaldii CCALA 016 TaxID=2107694 RepID=A0A2T1LTM0_9CHRO|nr:hypothetical protein [Aphanothece hegewaldii]PSF34468.1 hypothetical protein C7H19_18745 [Aphanothece hegewaldii CCALA 016]
MGLKQIDLLGEWNPQLLRELKGQLKPRNIFIAAAVSIIGQFLVYLNSKSDLPVSEGVFNRYCTGSPPPSYQSGYYHNNTYCVKDLNDNLMILDKLWWLDIFICLSILGIFALLVVGTYLLIADLSKEENRGTLNFIRLSPQSAKDIFLGKIFGVPILLYIVGALALPFHLTAGLLASIPLSLILSFYGVLIASCAFFYSAALLFGLIGHKIGSFQGFVASGSILWFLFVSSLWLFHSYSYAYEDMPATPFNFLLLFNPVISLPYLVRSTFLSNSAVGYLGLPSSSTWGWYGQNIWSNTIATITFILLNFALWTYWIHQSLKRCFHNPRATLLSKSQSYWVTGSFIVIGLGFVLQTTNPQAIFANYTILLGLLVAFSIILMFAISPGRQAMQDWMRYRHLDKPKNLIYDLLFSEKSPSTVAFALNLAIVIVFLVPAILFSPLKEYKISTIVGLFITVNMILIYGTIAQWILLQKTQKRSLWVGGAIASLITLPQLFLSILRIFPDDLAWPWFFSAFPMLAVQHQMSLFPLLMSVLGQWTALSLISFQMSRQLRKLGESSTKALLS